LDGDLEEQRQHLFNMLYHLTSDRELAADLTQEVLLRAWRSYSTFRGEASLKTWLARIALNAYSTERHRQQRRPHATQVLETLQVPDSSSDPVRVVLRREFRWCISHVLEHHVSEAQRVVLVLRDLQGLTYQEIAGALGTSVGAVKSRLHRARLAVRDHLQRSGCEALVRDYACTCDGVKEL
jgi:RNA polymerase sigma-70 factor (ECF subfamily)